MFVDVSAIDNATGEAVRSLRKSMQLSQTDLAKKCGVSFQQIQKYEAGVNRISMSRLFLIASALDLPPYILVRGIEARLENDRKHSHG